MSDWISLEDERPPRGEQVIVKGEREHLAYRCNQCGNCWRSPMGGGLIIAPTHWREAKENEKINTDKKIDIWELFI